MLHKIVIFSNSAFVSWKILRFNIIYACSFLTIAAIKLLQLPNILTAKCLVIVKVTAHIKKENWKSFIIEEIIIYFTIINKY